MIHRLDETGAVLVQGPLGTGKSHTIRIRAAEYFRDPRLGKTGEIDVRYPPCRHDVP